MSLRRAFADSPRPAVLLLGWLGSRDQHFNKYARLYQVRRSVQKPGARGGRANRTGNYAAAAACHCFSAVCGACFGAGAPTSPKSTDWYLGPRRRSAAAAAGSIHQQPLGVSCVHGPGRCSAAEAAATPPHRTQPSIQEEQDPCVPLCCCRTSGRR